MELLEIILIALGLAMDAFAVCIAAGTLEFIRGIRPTFRLAFHFGLVTRPHADILWTLPAPVGAFLTTGDPKGLALMAFNFGMAFVIYGPFVRAFDKRLQEQEAAASRPATASNVTAIPQGPARPQASPSPPSANLVGAASPAPRQDA